MTPRTVLISGAGVAGPTLAYWLARRGFRPTVVERAQGLRSSGSPVDVRGPAVAVADAMGIMPRLRAAATSATTLTFLGAGSLPMQRAGSGAVELPRGDLASILWQAARDDAEFLFDDTITTLTQDGSGVDVTFDRAAPRRFDLVVGADGLRSAIRRLAVDPRPPVALGQHSWRFLAGCPPQVTTCMRATGTVSDALAAFVARRSRRTGWVRAQTHRRDQTRNLPPILRDLTLRAFGRQIFRSNYRPLLEPI